MKGRSRSAGDGPHSAPWLTVQQVAERFQVSRVTVWRWIRSGRLAGIRVGRVRRIAMQDIRSFTRKGQREAGGALPRKRRTLGTRFTLSHPLWDLAGKGFGGRANISGNKYRYLAKAINRR